VTSASALGACTSVLRLTDIVARHMQPSTLGSIPWLRSIWATKNFVECVEMTPGCGDNLSEYMRPLDALLLFEDGSVVLVSEREADALQGLIWQHSHCRATSRAPVLMQLCYARAALQGGEPLRLAQKLDRSCTPSSLLRSFTLPCLTNLLLFDGHTMYTHSSMAGSISQRIASTAFQHLHQLMRRKRKAAEELVCLRGKLRMFPRSDLELASDGGSMEV